MKIYVASSWRNLLQPGIVHILRRCGHEVYDFRNPSPGNTGFGWSAIDPGWKLWTPDQYREALQHPIAVDGYRCDIEALRACDACVFVLPCGRSASWELGYAMGQGKPGYVVQLGPVEPELMFREATILTTMNELFDVFGEPEDGEREHDWICCDCLECENRRRAEASHGGCAASSRSQRQPTTTTARAGGPRER